MIHIRNTFSVGIHCTYTLIIHIPNSWKKTFTQKFYIFPGGSVVKNLHANAGDIEDMGSIPGFERSPGEGNGNPLQYSCLGNPMDGRAWWTTVPGVTESWTRLSTHVFKNIWRFRKISHKALTVLTNPSCLKYHCFIKMLFYSFLKFTNSVIGKTHKEGWVWFFQFQHNRYITIWDDRQKWTSTDITIIFQFTNM